MRVGFITNLLWSRYGSFWEKVLAEAGLETVKPAPERTERALSDTRLSNVPGIIFKLAAAQAMALETDLIVVPDLNPNIKSERGSAQDPWIASFPEALATTIGGLPHILAVPATLEPPLESIVFETLQNLIHDPAKVRRVWERNRSLAQPPRYSEPRWQVHPSAGGTVGVIGHPWLVTPELVSALTIEEHVVAQHELDPALLREEGARAEEGYIATDTEVLGAARYLERKGNISRLIMVADKAAGADAWLVNRVRKGVRKPFNVVYLQDALSAADVYRLLG